MRILVLMLCVLCGGVSASAQSGPASTESHGIVVVKFSWSKERINWEQDPFSGPIENFDEMRVRSRNEKRIADAKRGGLGAELTKAQQDARTDAALTAQIHKNKPGRYQFSYIVQVQNNGAKMIKAIDWDYIFFDLTNQSEMGRRQFRTEEKIAPGKTKELRFFLRTPPTQTVSIHSLVKNERANLGEEVVIVRVEYLDGSVWQNQ